MSASLVRCAQGGAAVGLVLLTISTNRISGGAALGGMLAALLTAPHIAGPWLARWLESARDSRIVLAASFAVFGLALAGGALLLGHASTVLVALLITIGGLCGPLMTGGLSSRLAGIVGDNPHDQRRAEGWDSATYGLANTAGPAAVGGVAAATNPLLAVVVLGCAAVLAAVLVLRLPATSARESDPVDPLRIRGALRVMVTLGPLRRVMLATMLTAVSMGGVMVIAVVFGIQLNTNPSAGAALAAAYGAGNLCGSVAVALFPLRGEPEKLTLGLIAANAGAIALCAVAPNYLVALATFAVAGASSAILFTATLAVRSVYSPSRARAQVFVCMAGIKMAAASAGTALAGTFVGMGPRIALVLGAGVTTIAVTIALIDRRLTADSDLATNSAECTPHRRQ